MSEATNTTNVGGATGTNGMSAEERERTLRRIASLRAMAEMAGGATQGEVENAMQLIAALMHKHNLDSATVDAHVNKGKSDEERARGMCREFVAGWGANHLACISSLVVYIADMAGCECYRNTADVPALHRDIQRSLTRPATRMLVANYCFYGERERVDFAVILYERLSKAIWYLSLAKYGTVVSGEGREYGIGFVVGLIDQFKEQKRKQPVAETAAVGAMVLRSRAMAKQWLKDTTGVKVSGGRKYRNAASDAYFQGKADGRATAVKSTRDAAFGAPGRKLLG